MVFNVNGVSTLGLPAIRSRTQLFARNARARTGINHGKRKQLLPRR